MIWWAAALLLFQQNPHTTVADVELGKKMYGGRCAGCHGPTGDGGKGTNLATPQLPRAQTDEALHRVIRDGLRDTEMPGHNMTPREIWQIAAYVRSLGRVPTESISGNAGRGRELVRGKGACLQCHVIEGEGGLTGPALTDIGTRRSPSFMRTKLLDPGNDLTGDFSLVGLTARGGQKVSGIRLNEDTWSIQVRDMNNKLHSFWKQDLADLKVERQTLMPSYRGRLNDQELNDVVAYLAGLRGGR